MAKSLLHTASLVLKIKGQFAFPTDKNSKTITIKNLIKLMERESSQIEYLGYDYNKAEMNTTGVEDCVMIAIHVIESPIVIDFMEHDTDLVSRFIRQVKKNTSRILIQDERQENNKTEKQFEFYVRGIADSSTRAYRNLKHA